MWGSLGKKILNERFGESELEEWSELVGNEKRRFFVYEREDIEKKMAYITKQLRVYHFIFWINHFYKTNEGT